MNPRDSRVNPIAGDELSRDGFGYRVVRVREVNQRFRAVEFKRTDQLYPCVEVVSLTTWRKMMKGATRNIAQTGWPLATWLPNGTVVSFFEVFSLASMPSSAMVTFAADDSASLWVNGDLVVGEADQAGNGYTVCSDTGVTCTSHTSVDVLPWLIAGRNKLRLDVAQRGGWSYGLNYSVALTWLDDPVSVPEPGTWAAVLAVMVAMLLLNSHLDMRKLARLNDRLDDIEIKALQYKHALEDIAATITDEQGLKAIARKALEEE